MTTKPTLFFFIVTFALLNSFNQALCQSDSSSKVADTMLCVGHHWKETQGKEFLEQMRKTYTTEQQWKKRAKQIRAQILKGAGLEKFPEKSPLNPIFGEKRTFDGYHVQNVAFESLPGVYVTGSLYTPASAKGILPGIVTAEGHWSDPSDYG